MEPSTETFNIKQLSDDMAVEVVVNEQRTTIHRETDLLRQKAYFEGLIAKGQAGLDRVSSLLGHITNAKR